jgi:hypothetical protein
MNQHECTHRQRPSEQHQDFEKALVCDLQSRRVADVIDTQQWIHHRLDGERNELKGLERLVSERVPTDFRERAEVLKDGDVGPEIEVGQKGSKSEGQRERNPAAHETDVEAEAHPPEVEDADHDQRVDDREQE